MKSIIYLFSFLCFLFFAIKQADAQKIAISAPEGSDISVDGKSSGSNVEIKIANGACANKMHQSGLPSSVC